MHFSTISELENIKLIQIHLCLCVSLFWCCNTIFPCVFCFGVRNYPLPSQLKSQQCDLRQNFLLRPVNSMPVVLTYDVELYPCQYAFQTYYIYLPFGKYSDFRGMWGFYVMGTCYNLTCNIRNLNPPCASAVL